MRLIDKLVFQDLIGPFVNGMMMFLLLVFAAGSLFQATDWLVKGIAVWVVVKLVLFKLPSLVTQVLPMAMLLAGLLGVGRLSADHELVAIFAAGISFPRMARVVAIMGAAVSVAAFFWNDWVVPPSSTAFWATEQKYIENIVQSHKPLSFSIDDNSGGGVSEFINVAGGYDSATNTLRDVTIVKFNTDRADKARFGTVEVSIHCRQAQAMDKAGLNWIYRDGEIREAQVNKLSGRTEVVNIWEFQTLRTLPENTSIAMSFSEVLRTEVTDPDRKSFRDLQKEIGADRQKGLLDKVRGEEVNLYGKIALPLASLIFGIVGASLGVSTRRGGGKTVGFGMAIFIVFLYWVFYHAMFVAGSKGGLPPMLASFLADIIGAVVGVILSIRASL